MQCKFFILGSSRNGKVIMCNACENRLALMYNNLSKSYTIEEFIAFKTAVDSINVEEYFLNFPYEDKVFLKTEYKHLFFCFKKTEIYELRSLLSTAYLRYRIEQNIQHNLN